MPGFDVIKAFFAYRLQFGGTGEGGPQFSILILWWLVFVAVATYALMRTRIGNSIFASGGNAASARAVGVPTKKVEIGLFAFVGFSAWFYAMHQLSGYNTVQAGSGVGGEFLYIIAAVVGGCALTGGVGSPVGSAIGALIYGMTVQGIVYAGWDPELVPVLPRPHAPARRPPQPVRQAHLGAGLMALSEPPIIEIDRHRQALRAHPRPRGRQPDGPGRRGHLRLGRQRSRRVHPDRRPIERTRPGG